MRRTHQATIIENVLYTCWRHQFSLESFFPPRFCLVISPVNLLMSQWWRSNECSSVFSVGVMLLDVWCASLVTALTQVFIFKQLPLWMSCFILYSALTCKWDLDLSETSWLNKVSPVLKETCFIHTLVQIFLWCKSYISTFDLFYACCMFCQTSWYQIFTTQLPWPQKMYGNNIVTRAEIKTKKSSVKLIFKAAVVVVYLTSCPFCS